MKDELMNVKIKFTEQSQTVAELKQEISRLETKVGDDCFFQFFLVSLFSFSDFCKSLNFLLNLYNIPPKFL